jgi:glycosyltransferase involved in cell wall biosynthesis
MTLGITQAEDNNTYVQRGLRLLFVVNSDWFFLSHRLGLAERAREEGFDVHVAAVDTGRADVIRAHGLPFHSLRLSRSGMHPVREMASVLELLRTYRRLRPDIVHHVTPKPVLYGSMAAHLLPGTAVVNAVTGLGYLFSSSSRSTILRRVVTRMYRTALSHPRGLAIFQNGDDRDEFIRAGLVEPARAELIRGAGVDCDRFVPRPEPSGTPVLMLVSRMIRDKGVGEFVAAARLSRTRGMQARWVLVGGPDEGNPTSIPREQLQAWVDEGVVEWWGHRTDMPDALAAASVVVLPSYYREGLPKVLLEAAAAAKPMIATDIPGCREVVRPGENGCLVPPRDAAALADAAESLLADPEMRRRYGQAARRLVVAEFADRHVYEATLATYGRLLQEQQGGSRGGRSFASRRRDATRAADEPQIRPDPILPTRGR